MPSSESIKVLHIIYSLYTGGAEQVVKNYALQLEPKRYRAAVCALTGGDEIVAELRCAGIPVHLLEKNSRWDLRLLPKLRRIIHAEAPDVIHVHDDMSNNWTAFALGWKRRIPVIQTIHKLYEPDSSFYFRAHQILSRRLYRRNVYLICCSEAVRQSLQLNGAMAQRLVTIHNGVDLRQFKSAPDHAAAVAFLPQIRDNGSADFRVGIIGSLRAEKGHVHLLHAAKILQQAALPVHFYLVGDGDQRAALEQLARRLEVQQRVHFLGYQRDVRPLLAAFDLVVVPSITEGLPLAVLEALAMKKPVIASAIGGIPEVIQHGETGWLVPPADPAALANTMRHVLQQSQERQNVAEHGFQRVAAEFTTERMIEKTARLYAQAIASTKKTPTAIKAFQELRIILITMFPNPQKHVPPNQTALLADHLEQEGAYVLRTSRETRRVFKTLRIIASMLRNVRRYDLVQIQTTPSIGFFNTAVTIGMAKLLGKKVTSNYFTAEGPAFLERFQRLTVPILKRADGIVVASNYVRARLQALGLGVTTIPHLLDFPHWRFKPRRHLAPRLLWVKRFDPEAQPELMLRAFQILQRQVKPAQLVMIGEGTLRPACQKFVNEQNLAGVSFSGFVPRENLPAYYDAADIFVLTSQNDNQPMCVLEAMACGLPVIAPKVGGLPDMIDDRVSGMLVKGNDPEAIAQAIQFLLQHPEPARQMAQTAQLQLEKYRWENVRKMWLDFYWGLLNPVS